MLVKTTSDTHLPVDLGPVLQAYYTAAELGLTAPGTSPLIQSNGYPNISVTATNSVAGTLVVQRYFDAAGTIPQGAAISVSLSAGVAGVLNSNDGVPFQSFTVQITGAGTLSNVAMLMQSR